MQERGVRRIDADFQRLQPVAVDVALECKSMAIRRDKTVDLRKCRRLAFAEISPEDAAFLHHWIGALLDAFAERRVLRLGRRFQALAARLEQPTVEGATQPAVFQPAERQIGAAMRAMALDQAVTALFIAKQHQILAQQFYRFDRTRPLQFIDQRRRLPVHPHQFPAGVLSPAPGQEVVLFLAHHGGVTSVATVSEQSRQLNFVRLLNEWSNYAMNLTASKPFLAASSR